MNWRLPLVLLAVLYVVFLLVSLPAVHLIAVLDIPRQRLSFNNMEGTALAGRAEGVRISQILLGDVEWRLAPLALFSGCLEYRLTTNRPGAEEGHGSFGQCVGSRRYVEGLTAKVAMNELAPALGAAARILAPGGRLDLSLETVRQKGQAYVDAQGRLVWRAARVGQGQPVRLGDVAVELGVAGERLSGAARNEGGDVALQVDISLDVSGGYEIQGALMPRGNRSVQQALASVATRQPDGSYALRLRGTL